MDIKQKPLYPFIVVQREKAPEKTRSGVAVAVSQEKDKEVNFGTIRRVSEGVENMKAGDRIQWKEYTGAPIFGEKDLFIVDIEEVLYILED